MAAPTANPNRSERPGIWIGHVSIPSDDLPASYEFYLGLGLRDIVLNESIGVLELAGGTHVVLVPSESDGAQGLSRSIDLMVDDVDAAREAWAAHDPSEIVAGGVHRTFRFRDPSGNAVVVHDSHVAGVV